ncbi:MAG: hypothetical protein LBP29_04210, partial [Treponema sp.]|nr:hypothetical protein [Treponema sp.]
MDKEVKRKTGMARLMELAMRRKGLALSSCFLSVLSTALSFTPFIAVYFIVREITAHFAVPAGLDR